MHPTEMHSCVTYPLINERVWITERDLRRCSGKVPEFQQLLVQRGFWYGATKVSIGALRVKNNRCYNIN